MEVLEFPLRNNYSESILSLYISGASILRYAYNSFDCWNTNYTTVIAHIYADAKTWAFCVSDTFDDTRKYWGETFLPTENWTDR